MYRIIFVSVFVVIQCNSCIDFEGSSITQITAPVDHAECPTWDGRTNVLYFTDIHAGGIYRYDYATKSINTIKLDGEVAPVIPSKSSTDVLLVGLNRSLIAITWDQGNQLITQKVLVTVAEDKPLSRMNDGKADGEGRIWFGTMGYEARNGSLTPNHGTLYRMSKNSVPIPVITPVNISNGLVWNKANNIFYYIDSPSQQIAQYDYDETTGNITNRRIIFDLPGNKLDAHPDGMTIDKDDNLWIALYGGGSVIHVNPSTGALLNRISIPASCVTSVAWGGPNLDVLFVTTSRYSLTKKQRMEQPGAGSVYAVRGLGTAGLPMYEADVDI